MGGAAPLLRLWFTVEISSLYDYYSDEEEEEGLDGEEVVRVGGLDLVLRRDPVVAAVGDGVADDDPDGHLVGKEAEGPGDEGDGDAAFADEPLADLEEDPVVVVEVRVSEGVPARAYQHEHATAARARGAPLNDARARGG